MAKKKRTKLKSVLRRDELKFFFLGYLGLCMKVFQKKYNLSLNDVYRLAWMHKMERFTKADFECYTTCFSWDKRCINRYVKDGWIYLAYEGERRKGERNKYMMTVQGNIRFGKLYRQLTGQDELPSNFEYDKYIKKSVDWLRDYQYKKREINDL